MGLFFNFLSFKRKDAVKEKIKKATTLLKEKKFLQAEQAYTELLNEIKEDRNYLEEYALILNNLVVIKHALGEDVTKLYKELFSIRMQLVEKDSAYFGVDYIYTLLMGVEWFNEPKENLLRAKSALKDYKNFAFYKDAMKKIDELLAKHQS